MKIPYVRLVLPLLLAAVAASPATASNLKEFDTVADALEAAKQSGGIYNALLKEVLVTSEPDNIDDDEVYPVVFTVHDFVRLPGGEVQIVEGPGIQVYIETEYYGWDPFWPESDDSTEISVEINVKRGQIITLAGDLDRDWDDDDNEVWRLERTIEDDFQDSDLYEIYADGFKDVEDFIQIREAVSRNYDIDDLSEFRSTDWGADESDLPEFNELLVAHGLPAITTVEDISNLETKLYDVNHGVRAVVQVHEEGVTPIPFGEPRIIFVQPFSHIRQDRTIVVKFRDGGLVPRLLLDGQNLYAERRPGILRVKIPADTTVGAHQLTLGTEDGQTSKPKRIWVRPKADPRNPAPILFKATVVGTPAYAELVLEGRHFTQDGEARVYVGKHRLETVLTREHDTLVVRIDPEVAGVTAKVRIGKQQSNRVKVDGAGWLRTPRPEPVPAEVPAGEVEGAATLIPGGGE